MLQGPSPRQASILEVFTTSQLPLPQKSICMHPISQVRHHQVYPGRATMFRLGPGFVLSIYRPSLTLLLCHIRPALTDDVAKMVTYSFVGSCLDYANSVLFGTSAKKLAHVHRIQSTLARVVTMQRKRISISKTLSDLHWLPMKFLVDF